MAKREWGVTGGELKITSVVDAGFVPKLAQGILKEFFAHQEMNSLAVRTDSEWSAALAAAMRQEWSAIHVHASATRTWAACARRWARESVGRIILSTKIIYHHGRFIVLVRGYAVKVILSSKVGAVLPDATWEDQISVLDVNWEILPDNLQSLTAEERAKAFRDFFDALSSDKRTNAIAVDRREFFENLADPPAIHFIRGKGSFSRYFGVWFAERLIVFENIHEGNAIYVCLGDWEEMSRSSKAQLLATKEEGRSYIRIVHSINWKKRVQKTLKKIIETRRLD